MNFKAQGLHSRSAETNWRTCAQVEHCQDYLSTNGFCRNVFLYDSRNGNYEQKAAGSTMWPTALTPTQLVFMFQMLYYSCNHGAHNVGNFCFDNCHWNGNTNLFDIVIAADAAGIISAYPAQHGTCSLHLHEWQSCGQEFCQGLSFLSN